MLSDWPHYLFSKCHSIDVAALENVYITYNMSLSRIYFHSQAIFVIKRTQTPY